MTPDVPDILKRIISRKFEEVEEREQHQPMDALHKIACNLEPARGFRQALRHRLSGGEAAVIAEIKKASPSKGVMRDPFSPADIALSYEHGGAACLSVLTDTDFFQGSTEALYQARAACTLPVLRKDFIVHPYQVVESRAMEADCILLIAAALDDATLAELYRQAVALGMDVLVEVHDLNELQRTLALNPMMLGINNRDLRTFDVALETTEQLLQSIPGDTTLITESGIHQRADVMRMRQSGVHAFLIGEAFMRADDPGRALQDMFKDI